MQFAIARHAPAAGCGARDRDLAEAQPGARELAVIGGWMAAAA